MRHLWLSSKHLSFPTARCLTLGQCRFACPSSLVKERRGVYSAAFMAGFRSLWGTLPAPSNAESGLVWIELKQRQLLLDVCPDSTAPVHLSNGRRMCSTRNASSCLAYSFGSNGDFEFEEEVLRQDPRCEMHTFDPTMEDGERRAAIQTSIKRASARLQASIRVHRGFGLAHFDGMGDIPHPRKVKATLFRMATLPTIMRELGHSHVNVIKIDTSGELEVLYALNATGASLRSFDQVLMEIHLYHPSTFGERQRCCYGAEDVAMVFDIMRAHGFAVMSLEPPGYARTFRPKTCCAEVAWIKLPDGVSAPALAPPFGSGRPSQGRGQLARLRLGSAGRA